MLERHSDNVEKAASTLLYEAFEPTISRASQLYEGGRREWSQSHIER